jgi:lipopolysaccharide transport system ATP-binding protein
VKPIIKVTDLSKQYHLGVRDAAYGTLRESMMSTLSAPFRRRRRPQRDNGDNTIWALKDISFEVAPGEVVGIIGRNGAGKSTLLKILSRITEPTTGKMELYGRVGSLLEVGTGFHPELTGRENIFLNGSILGMAHSEIVAQLDAIVAFAEIEKFMETPVKRYSSGMYVRLAFAVAAHLSPEILVVDEVLAVGDYVFQQKCLNKMHDVSTQGRTVLFVSHNLGAIGRLCQKCILLDQGRIVETGLTSDVVQTYMGSGILDIAEYVQESNPEKSIGLRRIALLNAGGVVKSDVGYNERLNIQLEYEVNRDVKNVSVGVALFRFDGTCVFTTADFDTQPELLSLRSVGHYRAQVEIPERWLNLGRYSLAVYIADTVTEYDSVEALRFTIADTGTPGSVNGIQRDGVLQPILSWRTEHTAA